MKRKLIIILGITMFFALSSKVKADTTLFPTNDYIWTYSSECVSSSYLNGVYVFRTFLIPFANDFGATKKEYAETKREVITLKSQIVEMQQQIKLLQEAVQSKVSSSKVVITKRYIQYKNSADVYDAVTERHIEWKEAMTNNIWDDIQYLPYEK